MSIWMNVLGKLGFIGAINTKILLLESRLTVNKIRPNENSTRNSETPISYAEKWYSATLCMNHRRLPR